MNEEVKDVQAVQAPEVASSQPVSAAAEANWRELRAAIDRERQARLAEEARRVALEKQIAELSTSRQEEEPIGADDDYIEARHFKKMQKEVKETRKQLQERMQQEAETRRADELWRTEMTLRTQFQDYANVMTPENLNVLEQRDPLLAKVIQDSSDEYAKRVTAYNMIKKIKAETAPSPDAEVNAQKLQENASKLKPAAALGQSTASVSPLRQASKYTGQKIEGEYKKWLQEQVLNDARNL